MESYYDVYFEVLCGLAGLETPIKDCHYFELMHQLYCTEFYWSVPNDDNRASDGIMLREKYGYSYITEPCNMLEMILALAVRCEDLMYNPEDGDRTIDWFWMMLTNLGVNKFRDRSFGDGWTSNHLTEICDVLLDREYSKDGHGGLFPLRHPTKDERLVEICYQMGEYLQEHPEIE